MLGPRRLQPDGRLLPLRRRWLRRRWAPGARRGALTGDRDRGVGFFGVDCSLTVERGGVVLHPNHAARRARGGGPSPRLFVYDLPEHTSLILQYRAGRNVCTPRAFTFSNTTDWNGGYAYTVDVALHEVLPPLSARLPPPAACHHPRATPALSLPDPRPPSRPA